MKSNSLLSHYFFCMKNLFYLSIVLFNLIGCSSTNIESNKSTPKDLLASFIKASESIDIEMYKALSYPDDVQSFEKMYPNKNIRDSLLREELIEFREWLPKFKNNTFIFKELFAPGNDRAGYFLSNDGKYELLLVQKNGKWYFRGGVLLHENDR